MSRTFSPNSLFTRILNLINAKADDVHDHAIADVTGLQTALNGKANVAHSHAVGDITNLNNHINGLIDTKIATLITKVAALESWQSSVKIKKAETFSVTTDSNGNFTINTSVAFTNPIAIPVTNATAGNEGYHAHIASVSGTTITGRAFANKTQVVLLGGTIDPDEPASSKAIKILVVEPA